eukprot:746855-Hanusia_phi.AAC.2
MTALAGPFVSQEALDFPALCARECLAAKGRGDENGGKQRMMKWIGRALDVGCAVGRSTFELSKDFKEVKEEEMKRGGEDCPQRLSRWLVSIFPTPLSRQRTR